MLTTVNDEILLASLVVRLRAVCFLLQKLIGAWLALILPADHYFLLQAEARIWVEVQLGWGHNHRVRAKLVTDCLKALGGGQIGVLATLSPGRGLLMWTQSATASTGLVALITCLLTTNYVLATCFGLLSCRDIRAGASWWVFDRLRIRVEGRLGRATLGGLL